GVDRTGATIRRFAIRKRLGTGGMGEVYLADDERLNRQVAVKRMSPAFASDQDFPQRFLKEAERASKLNSPRVAAIYDVLEDRSELFLVMEYVNGQTLRQRFAKPLSIAEFLDIGIGCAEGLLAAHDAGILHGDIKPENIMLTERGDVKILDFGIAKPLAAPLESDVTLRSLPTLTIAIAWTPA